MWSLDGMRKSVLPPLVGLVTLIISGFTTGTFDLGEIYVSVAATLGAVLVYAVKNKTVTGGVGGVLKALVLPVLSLLFLLVNGLATGEVDSAGVELAVYSIVTGIAVYLVPNKPVQPSGYGNEDEMF